MKKKVVIGISLVLLVLLTLIGVKMFDETNTHKEIFPQDKDVVLGLKEINYDADIPEVPKNQYYANNKYSLEDLRELLDIQFLQSKYFQYDYVFLRSLRKENGKIAEADFTTWDLDSKNNPIHLFGISMTFLTKYNSTNKSFVENMNGGMSRLEYKVKSLGVSADLFSMIDALGSGDKLRHRATYYMVKLNYDNVQYTFNMLVSGNKEVFQEDAVKDFLESLSYQ